MRLFPREQRAAAELGMMPTLQPGLPAAAPTAAPDSLSGRCTGAPVAPRGSFFKPQPRRVLRAVHEKRAPTRLWGPSCHQGASAGQTVEECGCTMISDVENPVTSETRKGP